jgi:hypothetical protein
MVMIPNALPPDATGYRCKPCGGFDLDTKGMDNALWMNGHF